MASKREISFLITGDAKKLAAEAAKAESELKRLDDFKLKAKDLGVTYDSKQVQEQLAKLNTLQIATKYAKVEADVKKAEAQLAAFSTETDAKMAKLSSIRMEIDKRHLDEQIAAAEKQLKSLGTEAQQAFQARMNKLGDSLTGIGKTMSVAVTAPIVAGFGLAIKSASDLGEAVDYTNRLMGDGAEEVHKFAERAAQGYGLSKTEVEKYAQSFATMLKGAGMSMEEVTENSIRLVKRTADIGSALNMTAEEVAVKLRSGLAGETEALRSIGVVIDEDAKKRYAWSHGIAEQGKQLNAQEKVLASFGLVMERTTDQADNFGDTIGTSLPNQMKAGQAESVNTAAAFGNILKPIMTDVMGVANKMVIGFAQIPPEMQKTIIVAGGLFAAMGPLLTVAGSLAKNWQTLNNASMVFRNHLTDVDTGVKTATSGLTNLGKAAVGVGIAFAAFAAVQQVGQVFKDIENAKIEANLKLFKDFLYPADAKEKADAQEHIANVIKDLRVEADSLAVSMAKDGLSIKNAYKLMSPSQLGGEIANAFGKNAGQKTVADFEASLKKLYEGSGVSGVTRLLRELNLEGKLSNEMYDSMMVKVEEWEKVTIAAEIEGEASARKHAAAKEEQAKQEEIASARIAAEAKDLQNSIGVHSEWLGMVKQATNAKDLFIASITGSREAMKVEAEAMTANERARYAGRAADEAAVEKAQPKARAWVQESLKLDKDVADSKKKLVEVTAEQNDKIKKAEEQLKQTRADTAAESKKLEAEQARIIADNADKVIKARRHETEVTEEAKNKMAEAAAKVLEIIENQNKKVEEASDKLLDIINNGREKVDEAKAKVQKVMDDRDEAILKAAQEYQQQLAENNRNIAKSEENLAEVLRKTEEDGVKAQQHLADVSRDAADKERDAIKDVEDAAKDSNRGIQDAMKDAADTAIDTARNISDSELDLARTIEDSSERIEDAKKAAAKSAEDMAERVLAAEERLTGDKKDYAKDLTDADKEAKKTAKEGLKDVSDAERDYAKAVAKSGANSDDARNAAERLQEVRERAAENNAKAAERIIELQEKAHKAETDGIKAVQKAEKEKADKEAENADKIADAEREAARDIADATKDRDRAIEDGQKANAEAAAKVAQAEADGLAKVKEAQEKLDAVRLEGIRDVKEAQKDLDSTVAAIERERLKAIGEVNTARAEAARLLKEKSDEGLKVVTENDKKVQDAKDDLHKVEQKWQDDLKDGEKKLSDAISDRKKEFAAANKLITDTEKQNVIDIRTAHEALQGTIKTTSEENQRAIDATATHATNASRTIKKEMDAVDEARKNAAETVKNAEDDVTTALDDQKTKWGELKTEFGQFDTATQKAIRNQINLIKGGKIDNGEAVPAGGLEQGLKDLIGDDSKGIKGVSKAVVNLKSDIDNLPKVIDIKINYQQGDMPTTPSPPGMATVPGEPLQINPDGTVDTTETPIGNNTGGVTAVDANGNVITPQYIVPPPGSSLGDVAGATAQNVIIGIGASAAAAGSQIPGLNAQPSGPFGGATAGAAIQAPASAINGVASPAVQAAVAATPAPVTTTPKPTVTPGSSTKLSAKASKLWGAGNATLKPQVIKFLNSLVEQSILVSYISDVDGWGSRTHPTQHSKGLAVDIMLKTVATANSRSAGGDSVTSWCVSNRNVFGINATIHNRRIYHSNGTSDPYVGFFSNGDAKDPHYNHVHVEWAGGGADLNDEFLQGVADAGGIPTNAGGILAATSVSMGINSGSPISATTGTATPGISQGVGIQASSGSIGSNGISAATGSYTSGMSAGTVGSNAVMANALAYEAEINRRRQQGLQLEERIQKRREEMLKLEELAAALRERQQLTAQGITDESEIQKANAKVVSATMAANVATEARIKADRDNGAKAENYSITARKTGADVEQEIKDRRSEAESLAGQAIAAAAASAAMTSTGAAASAAVSVTGAAAGAGVTIIDAATGAGIEFVEAVNVAGHSIIDASNSLGQVVGDAAAAAAAALVIQPYTGVIDPANSASHFSRGDWIPATTKDGVGHYASDIVEHGAQPIPSITKASFTGGSFAAKRLIDPSTNTIGSPVVDVTTPTGAVVRVSATAAQWISWWARWNQSLVLKGYPSQPFTTVPPSWWTGTNHPIDDVANASGSPSSGATSGYSGTSGSSGGGGSDSGPRSTDYPAYDPTTTTTTGDSGSSGSSSETKDLYHIEAPLIIQIDGKEVARATYAYTKQIARQNGDILADGSWRVDQRR